MASRRVEAGDTAPATVVADAGEAAGPAPTGGRVTVAEILEPPRYGSLPDRVRDALSRERDRVMGLHPAAPEAVAAHAWIEVVRELPWRRAAERLARRRRCGGRSTGSTSAGSGRRTRRGPAEGGPIVLGGGHGRMALILPAVDPPFDAGDAVAHIRDIGPDVRDVAAESGFGRFQALGEPRFDPADVVS